jgi:transposase-like protein
VWSSRTSIIRQWCAKFGAAYAAGLRRRRARAGDKWHLDEVFIKVNGVRQYLWRAVDQDGNVLDILVQSRRNTKAAKRFLAKLMKTQQRVPRVLVTDKLRSYAAAHRDLMGTVALRRRASSPCLKVGTQAPQAPWRTVTNRAFECLLRGFWAGEWITSGDPNAQCNSAR